MLCGTNGGAYERHIVKHGHVRIQSIILKDHRNIAVFRMHVIHQPIPEIKLSFCQLFQAGRHSERRRLSASGGTDDDEKFFMLYFQMKIF